MQSTNILLLVLVTLVACGNADDHIERHMVDALYDTVVNFTCMPKHLDPNITSSVHRVWLLPTGELLEVGIKDHPRVTVEEEGRRLSVKKVNDEDFGIYYCVVYAFTAQKYLAVQYGINVNGPYFGDLMKEYYDNIITACAAGAVCLVVMGTLCFCYNRHQARGDKQSENEKAEMAKAAAALQDDAQKPKTQFTNLAYVSDEVGDAGSKSPPPPPGDEGKQVQQELQDVVASVDGVVAEPTHTVSASAELSVKTKM